MDFSSLPKFTALRMRVSTECPPKRDGGFSPRRVRILMDLVFLAAIVGMLYELRGLVNAIEQPPAPAPASQPFDFETVQERYADIWRARTLVEVEALLGPPTEPIISTPELKEAESKAEHSNRHLGIPNERFWQKWSDPKDEGRWVAVLFAGYPGNQASYKVYYTVKKGF
jgi:hypothetical protein